MTSYIPTFAIVPISKGTPILYVKAWNEAMAFNAAKESAFGHAKHFWISIGQSGIDFSEDLVTHINLHSVKTHHLKTWPDFYNAIDAGRKTFEARKDDRAFRVGDVLILEEWDKDLRVYTGRSMIRYVTHILRGGHFGIEEGHCIMSISITPDTLINKTIKTE